MMGATLEMPESSAQAASSTRRLVIVAENSLIVEAIRIGFRKGGEFNLVGRADARRTSATTILGARPDVILVDDMDRSERMLELIREIRRLDSNVAVIMLTVRTEAAWLEPAFAAGTTAVISKATHPVALATMVRETLNGHIFHRNAQSESGTPAQSSSGAGDLPLTARELEILQLVASGSTNGDVARQLWVTEQTVKFHLRNIYRKLDVANRTQASHFAHLKGLVSRPGTAGADLEPELTVA